MKRSIAFLTGFGVGAGTMYYADPRLGRRRRATLGDKSAHLRHKMIHNINLSSVDFANRTQGIFSNFFSIFRKNRPVLDSVLEARVRSLLGRVISHPHAIEVHIQNGKVLLKGPILDHEIHTAISSVSRIPGVKEVDNLLESHKQNDNVPSLQGGRTRTGKHIDLLQANWAPATRMMMGTLGISASLLGFRTGRLLAPIAVTLGSVTFLRSVTNFELKRLLGFRGAHTLSFHKTMHISSPIDHVFKFWTNFQNFPRFISEIKEVKLLGNNRSRWVVQGPLSMPVHWDAIITRLEKDKIIAWKSTPESIVQNACRVRFFEDSGGTKVEIDFSYQPPIGILGHALAKLFGVDPKSRLDHCLMQMKQALEQASSIILTGT